MPDYPPLLGNEYLRQTKTIIPKIYETGDGEGAYLAYERGDKTICIDGYLTRKELEFLISLMPEEKEKTNG